MLTGARKMTQMKSVMQYVGIRIEGCMFHLKAVTSKILNIKCIDQTKHIWYWYKECPEHKWKDWLSKGQSFLRWENIGDREKGRKAGSWGNSCLTTSIFSEVRIQSASERTGTGSSRLRRHTFDIIVVRRERKSSGNMKILLSRLRAQVRLETIMWQSFPLVFSEPQVEICVLREPKASCHLLCKMKMISIWVCSTRWEPFEVRNRYSQPCRVSDTQQTELHWTQSFGSHKRLPGPEEAQKPQSAQSSDGKPG